jgi:hypothetical protein
MWQPEELFCEGWLGRGGKASIRDLAVSAVWDVFVRVGGLDIRMAIGDERDSAADKVFVRAVVETPDGEFLTAGGSRLIAEVPFTAPRTWCLVRLCRQIQVPAFWSTDMPQCYSLLIILEDNRGQVLDVVSGKFGISKPALQDIESRSDGPADGIPDCEFLYA